MEKTNMTPVAAIYAFTTLFVIELIAFVYFVIFFFLVGSLLWIATLPFKVLMNRITR